MLCADAEFCILISYHPESESGIFFLIEINNPLINFLLDICDNILSDSKCLEWNYYENKEFCLL